MNKKIIFIFLTLIVIVFSISIFIFNNKKELKCIYVKDNLKIEQNVKIDNGIIINTFYSNKFDKMDDVVDKYDIEYIHLKDISEYEGIETSIEQKEYNLTYNIKIAILFKE